MLPINRHTRLVSQGISVAWSTRGTITLTNKNLINNTTHFVAKKMSLWCRAILGLRQDRVPLFVGPTRGAPDPRPLTTYDVHDEEKSIQIRPSDYCVQ